MRVDGGNIGLTGDTDLLTLTSGVATVDGELVVTTLDIGGTDVTSTATELNKLDGVTSTAAELNYTDVTTLGTSEASKALTASASGHTIIPDDKLLKFGTNEDWTIEYDENGDDDLVMTGSDLSIESSTSAKPVVTIFNTNADANGSTIKLNKNGSSPATSDVVGNLDFVSEDSGNNVTTYGRIQSTIVDVTSGGEEGGIDFYVAENDGTLTKGMEIKGLSSDADITVDISTHDGSAGGLKLGGTLVTAEAAELNFLDGISAGNVVNSKVAVHSSSGGLKATGFHNTNIVEQSGTAAEDLTSTDKDLVWYANTAQADNITLPQATSSNKGMVIKIIVGTTDWSTTAFKLGFANGGSTVMTGFLQLAAADGSESVDGFVITANSKALVIDADDATAAGGSIGSTYTFTYLEADLVHCEAFGVCTTGTPALDANASDTTGI